MRLLIIRHGKAEADAPTGRDEDRPLAERGHAQARHLAKALKAEAGLRPRLLIASGHVRAWDTAGIIAQALDIPRQREPVLELGHTSAEVVDVLAVLAAGRHPGAPLIARAPAPDVIALVGHNPQLERLAGVILAGPMGSGPGLRTGEMIAIDWSPLEGLGTGRLVTTLRLDGE